VSVAVPPEQVATEGGSVTLMELPALRARGEAITAQAGSLTAEAVALRSLADGLWVHRGKLLLESAAEWTPPAELDGLIRQATPLKQGVDADDSKLQSIHDHQRDGGGGLLGKVGDWSEGRKSSSDRARLDAQLHPLLAQLGRGAPEVTVAEADALRKQAAAAESQAVQCDSQAATARAAAASVAEEVQRRGDALHEMGFDAPYLAASLRANGPPAIQSPLILKKEERACLAVAATLARQQTRRQWVGGSQGFSFPIGHTGIRYRVGSFRGHPVEQQLLGKLDSGTFVVTNQRVAFIGSTKSTSLGLAKLLHVECYSDALAVFQEGRENPNYYYVDQPKYVLFYINWVLNQIGQ
jgi:hypothetical protein